MIETPSLVDQYCHGVLKAELGLGTFETWLGDGPPASGTTLFDTRTGFAVRRWCPPLLGLEPHCPPARYLARRRELGVPEAGRRLLRGAGVGAYLVDTGAPCELTSPAELASLADAGAREVVRLEPLAQQVADTSGTVESFLANLAESVHGAAAGAVAFTSVTGYGFPGEPPGPGEVRGAAGRWLAARRAGDELTDPVLLRHLLWIAVTSNRPLQLHTGADPYRLTDFITATAGLGTDVILLDTYPHHRQAAQLAGAFPHVYVDSGPSHTLAELLESAPFGKILYSSGAGGLPELHVVGARMFGVALSRVLGGWVTEGECSLGDAQRVAGMVGEGNARRVYGV